MLHVAHRAAATVVADVGIVRADATDWNAGVAVFVRVVVVVGQAWPGLVTSPADCNRGGLYRGNERRTTLSLSLDSP